MSGRCAEHASARHREQTPGIVGVVETRAGRTNTMRLLLAATTYHPFYSGAAERFRRYLPGFRARGIEVSVFTGTPTRQKVNDAPTGIRWSRIPIGGLLPPEQVDGATVHRIRLPDRGGFRRANLFARGVRTFCRDASSPPDVVQMFTPAVAAIPELWRLRQMSIPTVATRTMMPELPLNPWARRIRQASIRMPSGLLACEVVGSQSMLQAFRDIGIKRRIEIIPHGVDTGRFRPARDGAERRSVRLRLGIPDRATVILFVGSITPRKGVHRLLEAWCRLAPGRPDLHLIVAGPRPENPTAVQEAYDRTLERLVRHSGAQDRVHFPGLVTDVEEFMRTADLFVLPSSREGMPNVVGEAMATGLPVVTTPFNGLSSEFGEPGVHYVLTGFDPAAMASDLATLLDTPKRRAEVGERGCAWVEQHLAVEKSIERYAALYVELAAEARARRDIG
jgi:glycosyltransferase involved in cell wall biosynthesis